MSAHDRLSLNQATVQAWGAVEAIEGCARHGIGHVGLWREKVAAAGLERTRRLLRDTGVSVSSLCRGGFFTAATEGERRARIDDNLRAIDEAAALGTDVLVLVCGGLVGRDLEGSRAMVEAAIAELAPYAAERGVRLGIEPLHPMFAADRSVVCTLDQALGIAERSGSPAVGVVVDAYHVWWDDRVFDAIARAGATAVGGPSRLGAPAPIGAGIVGFHVDDWIVPLPDPLLGRGLMGDGVIDVRSLRRAVDAAGYPGPIEVEIFQQELWDAPGDVVVRRVQARFAEHVLG